jgi:Xaa-Pro aminopeptidase
LWGKITYCPCVLRNQQISRCGDHLEKDNIHMKSDIDSLMASFGLDAILVIGPAQHNPPMVYFTGIAHLTQAILLKKVGEPPLLINLPMERDEAARTGLKTVTFDIPRLEEYTRHFNGDTTLAYARIYQDILTEAGVTGGRVSLYGLTDIGRTIAIFTVLPKNMPKLEIIGESGRSALLTAMETKSEDEIERIRVIGKIARDVMGETADFLTSHTVRNQALVKADGSDLTVGDVKRQINLWLAEKGAENPQGSIFAIGYDAAVPHSTGIASDPIRLGQTIVFDLYPREAGGGYFYDITRTWCLGYAPDEALALYEDVRNVFNEIQAKLKLDALSRDYQLLACDLFEKRGHPTLRSDPRTTSGYVHNLGHGVGLHVHELPMIRASASDEERLRSGTVFTVEPGLYYPERGLGMRLEDTIWARPDGVFEPMVEFPLDLVLPVKS